MDFEIGAVSPNTEKGLGTLYFAERSLFTAIAQLPSAPANQEEKVTISDAHTFAGTDGFQKLTFNPKKSNYKSVPTGGDYSRGYEHTLEIVVPGNSKKFAAFLKDNPDIIIVATNVACGGTSQDPVQIGSKCGKVTIKPTEYDSKTTEVNEDDAGWTVTFSAPSGSPSLFYSGVITEISE